MGIKRSFFNFLVKTSFNLLGHNRAQKISVEVAESLKPIFTFNKDDKEYHIYCPNKLVLWRAETYFTKEPETIEWMDTFDKDDILFDVGANIGLYSIYSAKVGIKVVAFEPESLNFALLNQNIYLNKVSGNVVCFNLAFADKDSIDYLYIPKFQAGSALNNFGETKNWQGNSFSPEFKQGIISYTIDSFVSKFNFFPNHIKIDVDGLESKIVKGALSTLRDKRFKSLLIELNESYSDDIETVKIIESCGLKLKIKTHSQMFDDSEFKNVFNYIFVR